MKHEKAARRHNNMIMCTCGAHWSRYYETCATKVGRSPRTGKFQTFGTHKMCRNEFAQEFLYSCEIGSMYLRIGVLNSARDVEGGYCFWEIMGPWVREMYGDRYDQIVDTN